jgi:hypothetical protein
MSKGGRGFYFLYSKGLYIYTNPLTDNYTSNDDFSTTDYLAGASSTMEPLKPGKILLDAINQRFIDEVGPVGDVLIEDILNLWRREQWRGSSAFRHYIKALAVNIDNKILRERFLHDVECMLLSAQSKSLQS